MFSSENSLLTFKSVLSFSKLFVILFFVREGDHLSLSHQLPCPWLWFVTNIDYEDIVHNGLSN